MLHLHRAYQKSITEDLDIVMPMYDLLTMQYNYCMTSGSLWSYYRDEVNGAANKNNGKTATIRSFEYKTKITRKHHLF